MIRARLDPDALHPARLAGTYPWAAWGLTRQADPHHLQLALPARHEDSYINNLLREAAHRLQHVSLVAGSRISSAPTTR
jgi:hypothetical protein